MQWPRWSETGLALVALAAAIAVGYGFGGARSQAAQGHLTVNATGESWVAPNQAQVQLGANETAPTAQAAMNKLSSVAKDLLRAMAARGIAAVQVQTSNLNVGQNYGPNGKPDGYQASEQFTVTSRKLGSLGLVISAATQAGANQVNGITLQPADPNAGQQQAIAAALRSAKGQAQAEAEELGVRLGRVSGVQVQQNQGVTPIFENADKVAAASVPIATGTQSVQVTVLVTYRFH